MREALLRERVQIEFRTIPIYQYMSMALHNNGAYFGELPAGLAEVLEKVEG